MNTAQTVKTYTGNTLYLAWQVLVQNQPRLRSRDAAKVLEVSEAELLASRIGIDCVRLQADWKKLLPALENFGDVMALTRNEYCVHERKGVYCSPQIAANSKMGLIVSSEIDLRFFLSGWKNVFALTETTNQGERYSIQFFDDAGMAVHKVYLTADSNIAYWPVFLSQLAHSVQNNCLEVNQIHEPKIELPDSQIDIQALRKHWSELKDTHHFFAMLKKFNVTRSQALRVAGAAWAEPLANDALPSLLEQAAQQEQDIMVFVGNAHCVQIHSGKINNLRWYGEWFNVLDDRFNLHLKANAIAQLWRVRKPTTDGIVTSWEAFDSNGELIIQIFGVRKPGIPELRNWRILAESFPVLEV